jgi:hypothetical protein
MVSSKRIIKTTCGNPINRGCSIAAFCAEGSKESEAAKYEIGGNESITNMRMNLHHQYSSFDDIENNLSRRFVQCQPLANITF